MKHLHPGRCWVLFALCLLPLTAVAQEPDPSRRRGTATVEVTRPKRFPHRIWAACDFEARTPDDAWFGPAETKVIPKYPGNATALGVKEKPYGTFSALMTGINPVPGPMMGKRNKMYCRYFLTGGSEATFQHFNLTVEDNNHIRVSGLTEGRWSEVTLDFTRDAARNDGSDRAFQQGERMDDLKVFVGKPGDGKDYELFLDDVIFFDDDPDQPPVAEPFPNRVIFHAAFDTGIDPKSLPKYWPGAFAVKTKSTGAPEGSYWGVVEAVPHRETQGQWIRIEVRPPRPVGALTKLRFRYFLSGTDRMTAQIFDATDQDNRHIPLTELTPDAWQWAILDFSTNARRNDGRDTPFAAGHLVDDIFFFVKPTNGNEVRLCVDEVTLFDAGQPLAPEVPFNATMAQQYREEFAAWSGLPREFTNDLGMVFELIPPGTFVMGSPSDEPDRKEDETPHRVTLTKPFYLSRHETTFGQFRRFVEATKYVTDGEKNGGGHAHDEKAVWTHRPGTSWRKPGYAAAFELRDEHPVVHVSHADSREFCRWLASTAPARLPQSMRYELPTEAQWEWACRAGSGSRYWWGADDDTTGKVANVGDRTLKRVHPEWPRSVMPMDDGHAFPAPVGQYRANAFGLHDLLGNVWEFCSTHAGPYPTEPTVDPQHLDERRGFAVRGGGWSNVPGDARCATRNADPPHFCHSNLGFRVAIVPE